MSKKYKYRSNYNQKSKSSRLDVNLKGFYCTCNTREKDCIKEAYNILNKYADKLYHPKPVESENKEESIEDQLKNELAELRSATKDVKRFQVVDSGAKNIVFITTKLDNPVELAEAIVADIDETKLNQSRFLIRLVPIEITCKAYINDIENAVSTLAEKYFKDSPKTFSVVFDHRNNNSVDRDEVIKTVANIVTKLNPANKVDLKTPDLSIFVQVIRGLTLIGIVPKYFHYKKYNLHAIANPPKDRDSVSKNDGDESSDPKESTERDESLDPKENADGDITKE